MTDIQRLVADHAPELMDMTPARTGNLSVRDGDRFAITPTGVPYEDIERDDVPVLDMDGERVAGNMEPSSEVPAHRQLYRDRSPGAIVHTHAPWATTLAVLHDELPPIHYMLAPVGDRVPVADYATYGTKELGENITAAMDDAGSDACIMANHGLIVVAEDLSAALERAEIIEHLAAVYCRARSNGDAIELPREELDRVRDKFETYGQRP